MVYFTSTSRRLYLPFQSACLVHLVPADRNRALAALRRNAVRIPFSMIASPIALIIACMDKQLRVSTYMGDLGTDRDRERGGLLRIAFTCSARYARFFSIRSKSSQPCWSPARDNPGAHPLRSHHIGSHSGVRSMQAPCERARRVPGALLWMLITSVG